MENARHIHPLWNLPNYKNMPAHPGLCKGAALYQCGTSKFPFIGSMVNIQLISHKFWNLSESARGLPVHMERLMH